MYKLLQPLIEGIKLEGSFKDKFPMKHTNVFYTRDKDNYKTLNRTDQKKIARRWKIDRAQSQNIAAFL